MYILHKKPGLKPLIIYSIRVYYRLLTGPYVDVVEHNLTVVKCFTMFVVKSGNVVSASNRQSSLISIMCTPLVIRL